MCPDNKMIKKLVKKFASSKKSITFAVPFFETTRNSFAEIAQLVEHDLAKVGVASSSLVFRSKKRLTEMWGVFVFIVRAPHEDRNPGNLVLKRCDSTPSRPESADSGPGEVLGRYTDGNYRNSRGAKSRRYWRQLHQRWPREDSWYS